MPPQSVMDACSEDKKTLCGDKEGCDAKKCMKDNYFALSTGCRGAIKAWKDSEAETHPLPESVRNACAVDAVTVCPGLEGFDRRMCMRLRKDALSAPCSSAIEEMKAQRERAGEGGERRRHRRHRRRHLAEVSDVSNVSNESGVSATPVTCVNGKPASTIIVPSGVDKMIVMAYSPETYSAPAKGRFPVAPVSIGAVVGVLVLLAVAVAVRRHRASRQGATLPLSSTADDGVTSVTNPVTVTDVVVTGVPL